MAAQFVDILAKWVIDRQMWDDKDYWRLVWYDMEQIFHKLQVNLNKVNAHNTAVCTMLFPQDQNYNTAHTLICRQMVNIYMFMNGLQQLHGVWTTDVTPGNTGEFEKWVRCIMGNVAMVELYGGNCQHVEMAKTVSTYMKTELNLFNFKDNTATCGALDYNKLIVGTKYVGLTMAEWIRGWRRTNRRGQIKTGKEKDTCTAVSGPGWKDVSVGAADAGPIVRIFEGDEAKTIHKIVEYGQNVGQDKLNELAGRIKENSDIREGLKEVMQEVEQEALKPQTDLKPATTGQPAMSDSGHDGSGNGMRMSVECTEFMISGDYMSIGK
ncbi:hypothetical protein AK88_02516 [Plasmodium fragile]|uniref:Schizont-infected cell agglutination extracellular alpha domain-containing protein n=1 Tax=Plasmodium fragile TaxID=5857 RepID=A0A0D9QL31_PLAFR|nr:uncharacterized protein AK88_02516 [Plasmodium fragile]KJP87760.1 hypothetical protein AK88_02516 [Plasmodium fragile]